MKKKNWIIGFVFALSIIAPVAAFSDSQDELYKIHPIGVLREEFSDNIKLTPTNRQSDWVTTVGLGLKYSTVPATIEDPGLILQTPATMKPSGVDLSYLGSLVSYAHNSDANYLGHNGRLNAWYSLDRNLTFRIKEYFIRSQDPRETDYTQGALPGQLLYGGSVGLFPYIRNVVEPSVDYRFGRENLLTLYYRNNIYQTENPSYQNMQDNYLNPRLIYWLDVRNGVTVEYGYSKGTYERSPDNTGNMVRGRYTYRFDPQTSAFGDYIYQKREFEKPGIPYDLQNPSVGIQHAFTTSLRGLVQVGYYWKNPSRGEAISAPTFNGNLSYNGERTTYVVSLNAGYRENLLNPYTQGLGFTKYYGGFASVNHRLTERITLLANGSLDRAEYPDVSGRKDWIWRVNGVASYQLLRWLMVSLTYYHQEQLSNSGVNYEWMENRVILNFNATL